MLFSCIVFDIKETKETPRFGREIGVCIFVNYGLLTGYLILTSFLFSGGLRDGTLVIASMPPAIAVVALSSLTKIKQFSTALISEIFMYIISLGMTPFILFIFATRIFDPFYLFQVLLFLVLLPLALSQVLRRSEALVKNRDLIIYVCFFLIIFTTVGVAIGHISTIAFSVVVILVLIYAFKTFGFGFIFLKATRNKAYSLFATYKNLGASATISLLLFSEIASLPAAIAMIFQSIFTVYILTFWRNNYQSRLTK